MEDLQDNVPDHLKCPICMDIPWNKVFQCQNGHIYCESCYGKLPGNRCPQCRIILPKTPIRCRAVEQSLDSLMLKLPCQFKKAGCNKKVERKDIVEHNSSCKYDFEKFGELTNVCGVFGFKNCSFKFNRGSTEEALLHFKSVHGMRSPNALLLNPFTLVFEDFEKIFNSPDATIFTPLIFDQTWWGHGCVYIIVARFNPLDKTLQFTPFYLIPGCDSPNNANPEVDFFLKYSIARGTVSCHDLLDCEGLTLENFGYFAAPTKSWLSIMKPNTFCSTLLIRRSEANKLQPPIKKEGLISFINYKPCDVLTSSSLNQRWPTLIRQISSVGVPQTWNEIRWVACQDFKDCKNRFYPASSLYKRKILICRANVNEKWLVGYIRIDDDMNMIFPAYFCCPNLPVFTLKANFEVLYTPPLCFEWAAWADLKDAEPIPVHDEETDLLICESRRVPGMNFIGTIKKDMNLKPDDHVDIFVLVLSAKGREISKRNQWSCIII